MRVLRPATIVNTPRVVITGGAGFIGSNLADTLAGRGEQVLVLDNLSRAGTEENANWLMSRHPNKVAIERIDVRERETVRPWLACAKAVLHLAAQVAVTTSLNDPIADAEINIGGTLAVLEAIRRHNPTAPVVFASTNKVYGKLVGEQSCRRVEERYLPAHAAFGSGVSEATPLDLYSPYGCSKGAADQYVRDYARVFGLRTAVLRMSCIYGPRQFGTEDQGWIAHFLIQALRGLPITIYGDGYQVRDALFVQDAVAAWLGALERIEEVKGRVFNLGGGRANSVSLREMMQLIAELHGRHPDVSYDEWRPGDQPWYVSDITAISDALRWTPRVGIREGLHRLNGWLSERFGPARPARPRKEARA
jgi:CDP-paratose 2-epimerase